MIPLNDIKDINLDSHGLFEASAGTGKTYTIEHLIGRIICEKKIPLHKILIVTFTEKATSELTARIRSQLLLLLKNSDNEDTAELIKESLDQFDQASIFTIHGFCQNILKDYQFESGSAFNVTLGDDVLIRDSIITEEIIKTLPEIFNNDLSNVLELIGFKEDEFKKSINNILKYFKQHPRYHLSSSAAPEDLANQINSIKQKLIEISDYCQNDLFELLVVTKDFKKNKATAFCNTLSFFKNYKKNGFQDYSLFTTFEKADFYLKKAKFSEEVESLLEDYLERLKDLNHDLVLLKSAVYSLFALNISRKTRDYKVQHNVISFDDMLLNTCNLINSKNSDDVIRKIREKFQYALVDEFQDTDIIQWEIFDKLFLDSPDNILYLIGDPKQSIYRFRNADINTYLEAKNKIIELNKDNKAHIYSLQTNYRSFPKLVSGFNELFKSETLFGGDSEISHLDCLSSNRAENTFHHLKASTAGIKTFNILPASMTDITYFNFIAPIICNEIKKLKKTSDHILYEDFCLLISARKHFKIIEPIFNKMGVPISLYKEVGINEAKEAVELKYLFSAIEDPFDTGKRTLALLTSFFNIDPTKISHYAELSNDHLVMKKMIYWNELSLNRNWAKLFKSIIENSGVMFLENASLISENRISKFNQIFEWLLAISLKEQFSLKELLSKIEVFSSEHSHIESEENKIKSSTDKDKVQVMTIHASKGLEFPFVFNVSLPSKQRDVKAPYWVNNETNNIVVLDDLNEDFNNRLLAEEKGEFKRQQYVACTRAIHSLYLFDAGKPANKTLYAEIISAPILNLKTNQSDLFEDMEINEVVTDAKAETALLKDELKINVENFASIHKSKTSRQLFMKSFSSLSSNHYQKELHGIEYKEFKADDDQDISVEEDLLPRGANTGNLIHHIFENISFQKVKELAIEDDGLLKFQKDEACRILIKNAMDEYIFDHIWFDQISKIVWDALSSKVFSFDKDFRLCDLEDNHRIHELEFYFPLPKVGNNDSSKGYMQGFIDLVFEWKNKFYILDWKSNYSNEGYQRSELQSLMTQNEYDLQYMIYMVSVYRWLNGIMGKDFNWSKSFGGVIYLFVRGVDSKVPNNDSGVYFEATENILPIKEIRDVIVEKLSKKRSL
ncbi:MAG: hypothetical protein COA79_17675 [Planctomycetota bacterium]|nr:MAG: hypothetical protein COA79_17675 [Planctomycetota bacterium]